MQDPQEVDEVPDQMQVLEMLTPEAKAYLNTRAEDRFSFNDFLPDKYFDAIGRHVFYLDVDGLKDYVGIDDSAPLGAKTPCVYDISNILCKQAKELYPNDEHLKYLLKKWAELEVFVARNSFSIKRPSEIVFLNKEFHSVVSSWNAEEIQRLHKIFSDLLASLGEHPETYFIPRRISMIYMRKEDGELIGQLKKRGEKITYRGSFVTVVISPETCFSRVAFTLGLRAGCYVLPACGNADDPKGHLYRLRSFRMVLDNKPPPEGRRHFERLGCLYAQTYEGAMGIKKLKDETAKDSEEVAFQDLWLNNVRPREIEEIPAIWVTGAELEKELGQPDPEFRHTVRAVAVRKRDEWEVLTVTERGDDPEGRTGKPPLVGVPGGMREKDTTLRQTLCRETENEAQTKSLEKIIALVALHNKAKRKDFNQENVDHWYYVKLDNEAGLSKKMIEGDEIYAVRWMPLSELATCGFQFTRQRHRTVWDVRKVHEQKLLSINHASWLAKILPTIPEIKIPENWEDFRNNIRKFQKESST